MIFPSELLDTEEIEATLVGLFCLPTALPEG